MKNTIFNFGIRQAIQNTINSDSPSFGFTLHIIFITFLVSLSIAGVAVDALGDSPDDVSAFLRSTDRTLESEQFTGATGTGFFPLESYAVSG